jgi:2-iminobutanoate/2-iminopropanoate deaminase
MRQAILTDKAPAPIGPYSQAIRCGNLIFASGQLPLDPKTGALVTGITEETRQVFENLKAVLEAAGSSLDRALKVTVFMKDLGQFAEMNKVYATFLKENAPARSTIQVAALPRGVSVEIDVIAEA